MLMFASKREMKLSISELVYLEDREDSSALLLFSPWSINSPDSEICSPRTLL